MQGRRVPAAITRVVESKVDLFPHLTGDWDAFWILSASRPLGFGAVGAIPLSEINAYSQLYGVMPGREVEDLIFNVRILDSEFLTMQREDSEHARKSQERQNGNGSDRPPNRS